MSLLLLLAVGLREEEGGVEEGRRGSLEEMEMMIVEGGDGAGGWVEGRRNKGGREGKEGRSSFREFPTNQISPPSLPFSRLASSSFEMTSQVGFSLSFPGF